MTTKQKTTNRKLPTFMTVNDSNDDDDDGQQKTVNDNQINNSSNSKSINNNNNFPYINYTGEIIYLTDMADIAFACDNLIQWLDSDTQSAEFIVPIAFDMEWPFSFKFGSGKTSVIQLCADINKCYVFQVNQLKKLPAALMCLLYHRRVCLHGVNIKNDFRKLQRDFPDVVAQKLIDQCCELGEWCNTVTRSNERWSLARLVLHICNLRINKNKDIRTSRWDLYPLSEQQQLYAAIDVYIGQVIYLELAKRELDVLVNESIEL